MAGYCIVGASGMSWVKNGPLVVARPRLIGLIEVFAEAGGKGLNRRTRSSDGSKLGTSTLLWLVGHQPG